MIFQVNRLFIVNNLLTKSDMTRTVRNLDDLTKQKISNAMKLKHQQRSESEKRQTAEKQSEAMKNYWRRIPKIDDTSLVTSEEDWPKYQFVSIKIIFDTCAMRLKTKNRPVAIYKAVLYCSTSISTIFYCWIFSESILFTNSLRASNDSIFVITPRYSK